MSRPKKEYIALNMKVAVDVMEKFNAYCEEVGQTKTLAFERIVTEYIDKYNSNKWNANRSINNHEGE